MAICSGSNGILRQSRWRSHVSVATREDRLAALNGCWLLGYGGLCSMPPPGSREVGGIGADVEDDAGWGFVVRIG